MAAVEQTDRAEYVVVGGGMVADAAARGIRDRDPDGRVLVLGDDVDPPYTRPALSKKLWIDPDFTEADNDCGTAADTGAEVRTGVRVTAVDTAARTVTTDAGDVVGYGSLLLATGGRPSSGPLEPGPRVIAFRTAQDYRDLRQLAGDGRHVVVVGGSYIGTEIAAALAQNDTRVTLVMPDEVLGASMFPPRLAEHFQRMFAGAGVTLRPGTRVTGGTAGDDGVEVTLDDGSTLAADAVVLGLGITPSTELAEAAGLAVDDGVVVDGTLRTSDPHVFAAGDVAQYRDPLLGVTRVEHVDNAKTMGQAVGELMAGRTEPYDHTPFFYSQVLGTRYEAVGTLDGSARTVEDWATDAGPEGEGVVYYLDEDGRVTGVLLWDVAERVEQAKEVLADRAPQTEEQLRGRITAG
ncbi:NAD(P)/FAD-dependent oxidoreductase [Pseudokineococcus lusitanus]|uniref:Pyridine nucleotide-disulfide oxidoreductase n=1 Tax=Pseudokineococcus lusitanus TaxID=763993 RepID=A0A3N1HN00_9ACTN|nr:FAD-dependent oxidoreductase [Pseudokineococcus lusitanus]ROP43898.1 pyridine nucleotide-disulfide oxidoreductase [Pseudokineococcus lusitanus]